MKCTLEEWQRTVKPTSDFLLQGSTTDENDGWQPFPIGMSYRWADLKEQWNAMQLGDHTHLLLVSINTWTDKTRRPKPKNRQSIVFSLKLKGFSNQNLSNTEYGMKLRNFKFVASPEGNGIDCHRTYEALMAGCIPIVEDHPGIRKKYEGCPVLYTNDYKEINTLYLINKYQQMLNQVWDFSRLFYSFYSHEMQAEIRKACNYWMKKLRPEFPPFYKEDGGQKESALDADRCLQDSKNTHIASTADS